MTQKTKDRAPLTPLKLGSNSGAPEGYQFLLRMWHPSCDSCYKPVISHKRGKNRITVTNKKPEVLYVY